MQRVPMTPAGLSKLQAELKHLKTVERPQNVRDIETAREHGDLKENAEYHAAKEKQAHIAAMMRHVEDMIARAEVIDPAKLSGNKIVFGATVALYDLDEEKDITYCIVGAPEADSKRGYISIESPIARALIGKYPEEEVIVQTPSGERTFEVVEVKFQKINFEESAA